MKRQKKRTMPAMHVDERIRRTQQRLGNALIALDPGEADR
jgi:hypothetical protein